ncbi:hypothetical protein QYE76_033805 [Lolium multiflorum]|uniref:TF-B3 domain-containing protein n=1 Tax=Lolium multiflorum TaxID=4521 RepID=A0AAD8QWT9_LOLMU|nr:hypothetical protein QYE76_033805 [Lolium multiflorum]
MNPLSGGCGGDLWIPEMGSAARRLSEGQHKDYLDACSEGSFTSKEVEARWDLLDRIEDNAEGWENDKGKESGYADKLPFKPLPPKEGNEEKEEKKKKATKKKKKKKKENKKKEVTTYPRMNEITLSNRKYVAPNDYCDNESEYDDLPMLFTYISDHDLNEHTTFDIANLWETNSENDDNNCHSVSAIHASSHNDIESSKLGEEVFENPFATDHYVFDTSPSNNNDGMDTDKPTVKDNYSISYDDTVPPIFDDYYKECYDIGKGGGSRHQPSSSSWEERCFEFLLRIDDDPLAIKRLPDKFAEFIDGGKMYLHTGWDKFARDLDLEPGCQLTFLYEGDGEMIVKAFDDTACRRHYHTDDSGSDTDS